ncbi:MAG TPA: leucine-rich repeat domain-containing protein [Prosthecobacter sp.]
MSAAATSEGLAIARARIARECEVRSGVLDLGDLGLAMWPQELWELELGHLTCLNLGVGWTDENNGFHPAAPGIAYAPNVLVAAEAQTLWPRLPQLQRLSLAGARGEGSAWANLAGLEALARLRVLDLSWTAVEDLRPLAGLAHLQVLDASYTLVSSIAPLSGLLALRHLDLSHTQVADLSALADHPALQVLLCDKTPVASLAPLAGLPALSRLDVSQTQITSLQPLARLASLQSLHSSWTRIEEVPEALVNLPSLQTLVLHETAITGVPASLLSPDAATSCLEGLRGLPRAGQ